MTVFCYCKSLTRLMGKATLLVGVVLLMTGAPTGCASTVKFTVRSSEATNNGTPVYFVIRKVDGHTFLAEPYNAVAEKVFQQPVDPSILERKPVFPGQEVVVRLDQVQEGQLGLYFLFSTPEGNWRYPLQQPVPEEIIIELGKNQISKIQVRR